MKKTPGSLAFLAVGAVVLLAGCSSLKVGNDYNPSADFPRFVSFDWLDNRPGVSETVRTAMSQSQPFDRELRRAVSSELLAKGLIADSQSPDLLAAYHVGVDDQIDVADWGYRYQGPYRGWGGDIDVNQYRAGTLVLDLIDTETMSLVWRASVENTFDDKAAPEETARRIADAVQKIFQLYPPAE